MIYLLFMSFTLNAQSDRYQMYVVHEDHIKDGMKQKHENADKALLDAAKEHNMKGMDWLTFQADDNRVMYLSPINNFADLDKNPFEDLQKKMGKEAFDKLFDSFEDTYSKHGDYILRLDNELSYMPDGMSQTSDGNNYRELVFYHIPPGKGDKAEELARSVKKLYSEKGSKVHYRVYKSGFGTMENYFMVAVSGKDKASVEKARNENMELIGEEGKKLFAEIEKTASKQEVVTGHTRPDLSYITEN
ncbi:hypothetical protein [Christiangramia sp. SM2212]|uniref:Uncharacterized protein n=1 Tax=Christiangramia sediminicola TaxID=3073267 RepID=A0ABU1ENK0_9FLAO|nr:hypothetical protein [Christiangramia sp. SM2212]MDR5589965.1 hypothetical protein [Christiangramia sp. SM2212]